MSVDVLHSLCVQVMDADQVTVADADQVTVADEIETVPQEINTKREEVHVHLMVDKVAIVERSGSLTLKDKD